MGSEGKTSNRGGGGGRDGGGVQAAGEIPPGEKKMVQSLREIVGDGCTDEEIYAALADCHMDPSDALNRLLSQDTFHEVKSKRERRKEMKETHESKARGTTNGYRAVRVAGEHSNGRLQSQISYNDLGKTPHRRENGVVPPSVTCVPSLTYRVKTMKEQPPSLPSSHGNYINTDSGQQISGAGDTVASSSSAVTQSAWSGGTAGHFSMANILKMGRSQSRSSQTAQGAPYIPQGEDSQNSSLYRLKSPYDSPHPLEEMDRNLEHHSHVSKANLDSSVASSDHGFDTQLSVSEKQNAFNVPSVLNASTATWGEKLPRISNVIGDGTRLPDGSQSDEVRVLDGEVSSTSSGPDRVEFDSSSSRKQNLNGLGGASHLSEVSSAAVSLKELNLGKDPTVPSSEGNREVVFPNYMQAVSADCSHLSFGTYKSGAQAALPGPLSSNASKFSLEQASEMRGSPPEFLETRNSVYPGQGLRNNQLGSIFGGRQSVTDDAPLSSLPELLRRNIPKVSGGHEFIQPLSLHNTNFKKTQNSSAPWSVVLDPNDRSLALDRQLEANSMPMPVDLFSLPVQSSEVSHHTLPGKQSVPSRYGDTLSSNVRCVTPLSEITNPHAFSLPFSYSPTPPVNNLATTPSLPEHQLGHLYAQPTNPVGEAADLTGYPTMPHGFVRNPPTSMQQAYRDSNVFYDSMAGRDYGFSQYNGIAARSSLPHADAGVPSYGGLTGQADFRGGFLQGLSTTSGGSVVGHDVLPSHYQQRNVFPTLHQVKAIVVPL
ncbi:hypothetical protein Tsubulata_037481 [Turnera subulata]|uniref:GBF-interacting protein 1 N-terminal domain-containing protein n=1 Tax=Turnera subulata TaxID=218843 RepID=A0A9Q0F672_9ROSI|nr:hypothetical protein Tsubulata_037481 [Turnera subulata]